MGKPDEGLHRAFYGRYNRAHPRSTALVRSRAHAHALNVTQHLVQGGRCCPVGDRAPVRRRGVVAILGRLSYRDRLRPYRRVCERSTGHFGLFTAVRTI